MRTPRTVFVILLSLLCTMVSADGYADRVANIQSAGIISSIDTPDILSDIVISGSYAYVATGKEGSNPGLLVIDISNPMSLSIVGSVATPARPCKIAVAGETVYVVTGAKGLQIIDVALPSKPRIVGSIDINGYAVGVAVSGSFVYVADQYETLRVIDVSDPSAPSLRGSLGTPSMVTDVEIAGSFAYIVGAKPNSSTVGLLKIVDVSDPSAPSIVGSVTIPQPGLDVLIRDSYACVSMSGSKGSGLAMVDISSPTNARVVGWVETPGQMGGHLKVSDNFAYITSGHLQIIDISDPSAPFLINEIFLKDPSFYAEIVRPYAYITYQGGSCWPDCGETGGLQVLDISDPFPIPVMSTTKLPLSPQSVAVSGSEVYVATGDTRGAKFTVFDRSNSASPSVLGSVELPIAPKDVAISGSYAYVTLGEIGPVPRGQLEIIDISDKNAPRIISSIDTAGIAYDVALSGSYAFVANGFGLRVIDVADPASPRLVGSFDTPNAAEALAVVGSRAYVSSMNGIEIVDVSNPSSPAGAGSFYFPEAKTQSNATKPEGIDDSDPVAMLTALLGSLFSENPLSENPQVSAIAIVGDYLYLAYGKSIRVVDASEPSSPKEVASLDTLGRAMNMAISDSYCLVAEDESPALFEVADLSEPSAPRMVAKVDTLRCGRSSRIAVDKPYVYITGREAGLTIVNLFPEADRNPKIAFSPPSFTASLKQGERAPRNIELWNSGDGTLSYVICDNAPWIDCKPYKGGTTGEHDTIEVSLNSSYLEPGDYSARITIGASDAANSPQFVDVSLTVEAAMHTLVARASPDNAGTVTGGGTYKHRERVTLEAHAEHGWEFDHWESDHRGISPIGKPSWQIGITSDTNVQAIFVPVTGMKALYDREQRMWALATCAILTESNDDNHSLLGGYRRTQVSIRQSKRVLRDYWGVENRDDLLEALEWLKKYGDRKLFADIGSDVTTLNIFELEKLKTRAKNDPELLNKITIAQEHYRILGKKSILAWDYGRYVSLCGWGYVGGFLTEDEAWEKIMPIATTLQNTFDSWEDLGGNYVIGREFWSWQSTQSRGELTRQVYEKLYTRPSSPWRRIPWDLDLSPWNAEKEKQKEEQKAAR